MNRPIRIFMFMLKVLTIIAFSVPVFAQAWYNATTAQKCAEYHVPGKTYNRKITLTCSKEWERLTNEAKLSFPKNFP